MTSITLAGILLYLGVVCFILLFILNQKKNLNFYTFGEVDIAFLIYILVFVLSKTINSGIETGFYTFFRMCQDYFIYLWIVFYLCKNSKNSKFIQTAILIAASVSVFYGLLQFFHFDFFHRQVNVDRLSGFHKNPYTYSGQLIILFFFLTPVLFTMMLHRRVFKRIKKVVLPTPEPNIRFKLWGIALSVWKRNILFGTDKFPVVAYQAVGTFPVKYLTHAHNVYLQILVTNGLVGFLSFINLFYAVLKTAFYSLKSNKYAGSLISVLLAFLIEGIFEYFWGDSEVRYLLLYYIGFVLGNSLELNLKKV